jgi:hypothetical protein
MNTMNRPQMQHVSPLNQPAQMQQRPAWVDDLFRKMDKVESKLNKLVEHRFCIGNIDAEFWEYIKLVSCENCVGFVEFILVYKSLYK